MLGTREGIINGRDLGVGVRKLPKVVTSCCLGDKLCPEREGSQMQSSLGDKDLEHRGAHTKATAALSLMHFSLLLKNPLVHVEVWDSGTTFWSSRGNENERFGQGTSSRLQPEPARGGSLEAWRPSRGKGEHLWSPLRDKELCVSFGFSCQPSPGQGSNKQDCAQGSNNEEMQNPLSRGRSILLTLGLHQDLFTKPSSPRPLYQDFFTKRSVQTAESDTAVGPWGTESQGLQSSSSQTSPWLGGPLRAGLVQRRDGHGMPVLCQALWETLPC